MSSGVEAYLTSRILTTPLREDPYPHVYVERAFPEEFYAALRSNWPGTEYLAPISATGRVTAGAYSERYVMPMRTSVIEQLPDGLRGFWSELASWLLKGRFMRRLIQKFGAHVERRFPEGLAGKAFTAECLIVRDHTNFGMGPHTDGPHRLLSLLFYCPDHPGEEHLGTSIYTPIDPEFRSAGGPHHSRELFNKVATMSYAPNTLFAFFKTDWSFHGLEPIRDAEVRRDLLIYDIQVLDDAGTA
jgi:hypothetical protein